MSAKTALPFKTEIEERGHWERRDSSNYVAWSKAEKVLLPNLKPAAIAISLSLLVSLLECIKLPANERQVR